MKSYPKIEYYNKGIFGSKVIGFFKEDGSNLRFEWGHKRGWFKYGTRNVMIDRSNDQFGKGIDLFLNKYADDLESVFRTKYKKVENFVIFGEFVGSNSFAGQHIDSDIKDVIIFDVNQYRRGLISPFEFVDNFGHLHIPDIVYDGKYTEKLIEDVKLNQLSYGKLKEGIVVKGMVKNKGGKEEPWQVKIKTNEWLQLVKEKFGDKYLIEELNGDISLL